MKSWQLLSGPILALLAGGPAFAADDSHCTSVTDSAARLACYDAAHNLHPNTAAVPAKPFPASSSKPVAPTPQAAQSAFGLPAKVDQRKEARRLTATVVSLQNVPVGQFTRSLPSSRIRWPNTSMSMIFHVIGRDCERARRCYLCRPAPIHCKR